VHASHTHTTTSPPTSHCQNPPAPVLNDWCNGCGLRFSRDCQHGSPCSPGHGSIKRMTSMSPAGWIPDHCPVPTRTIRHRSPMGILVCFSRVCRLRFEFGSDTKPSSMTSQDLLHLVHVLQLLEEIFTHNNY